MPKRKLTDAFVRNLRSAAAGTRNEWWDSTIPGFGVRVTDRGAKSYVLYTRWPPFGTPARRTIGDAAKLSLGAARSRARAWLDVIAQGRDPREDEVRARQEELRARRTTFGAVAEAYIDEHLADKRRGKDDAREIRKELMPRWRDRPVADINRGDVVQMVKAIANRPALYQAHQVLGHIKRIYSWAIAQGEYGIEQSPAILIKPKTIIRQKGVRQRVLTDDEVRAFWRATGGMGYPFGSMFRLILFTGARISEASDATWAEFDMVNGNWIIPPERFKSGVSHFLPLSKDACALLELLPRFRGDFLFTTTLGEKPVGGFSKAKARLDNLMKLDLPDLPPFVIHDVRRTVRTRLSQLRVQDHVAEMVIGHGRRGLQRVYDQHSYEPEMREALEFWAAKLLNIVDPKPPSNVIDLPTRART